MKARLIAFFSSPFYVAAASLAGIIGIPLSIYFYQASMAYPKLTYYVHPIRAPLVEKGTTSAIGVTYNGKPVTTDITAAQIAIWNAGKLPIRPSDVLQPLMLKMAPSVPILEASIQKSKPGCHQIYHRFNQCRQG